MMTAAGERRYSLGLGIVPDGLVALRRDRYGIHTVWLHYTMPVTVQEVAARRLSGCLIKNGSSVAHSQACAPLVSRYYRQHSDGNH